MNLLFEYEARHGRFGLTRWSLGLGILSHALFAQANPDVLEQTPIPPKASSTVVAVNVVQNGSKVSMATLEATDSLESMLGFYRELWADEVDERAGVYRGGSGGLVHHQPA